MCADGWTLKAEQVACRQLGYNNVKVRLMSRAILTMQKNAPFIQAKEPGSEGCSKVASQNYCGQEPEPIVAVNFNCIGAI